MVNISALENPQAAGGRVLIADDDADMRRALKRILRVGQYEIDTAANMTEAVKYVHHGCYDAILSDIHMPDANGIELLREVRSRDLDVPVILMTGLPEIETAIRAVEYGAFRYLQKPVAPDELKQVIRYAVNLNKLAKLKRQALLALGRDNHAAADAAGLEDRFDRALDSITMVFQPIVSLSTMSVHAHEALVRCDAKYFPHPGPLITAAERLNRLHDLGRAIRAKVATAMNEFPEDQQVFVNLHPSDLTDPVLGSHADPLSAHANRVVLEITERAPLHHVERLDSTLRTLRSRGYRLAIDDLGAGFAGLSSFVKLRPEVVKLDMSLVRDIDKDQERQHVVGPLLAMCSSMGVRTVVEGVETTAEAHTLARLGADLMQGYVFARPSETLVIEPPAVLCELSDHVPEKSAARRS